MAGKRRTRPGSDKGFPKQPERPVRTDALLPLNAPYPGCCTPYPDARFKDQVMVELNAHHTGPNCKGFMEPMSVEEWNAEIDRRTAGRSGGGDD